MQNLKEYIQNLKEYIGNILFYAGLIFIVLSIIGRLVLNGTLPYKYSFFGLVVMGAGMLQGLLICGLGVIVEYLKEIKNK